MAGFHLALNIPPTKDSIWERKEWHYPSPRSWSLDGFGGFIDRRDFDRDVSQESLESTERSEERLTSGKIEKLDELRLSCSLTGEGSHPVPT